MADEAEAKTGIQFIDGATVTVIPLRPYGGDALACQDIRKFVPDERVGFAMSIIEKHALVAAVPDGEDSAGRQRLAMPTPHEIVDRACDIADEAFKMFEARGWRQAMPNPDELMDMARANSKRN
jgi:hypothetical protein